MIASARESLQRQRNRLVVERNRLYDVEATISAAGRSLIRTADDASSEAVFDVLLRDAEGVRLRTAALQQRIDRIDQLRGAA